MREREQSGAVTDFDRQISLDCVAGGSALEKRILVVEDETSIAHLIAYNLEQAGYRAAIAVNGGEALHLVESFSPHLLTLDLLLPQQSGWQVLGALRAHPRKQIATLPVIVVSALASPQLRQELRRNGVCHCLGKPFSVTELCLLVNNAMATCMDPGWASPL
jgi:DNA-binding response OmpR family regulator